MDRKLKRISRWLVPVIIICIIFSLLYLSQEANHEHECVGQGCSICLGLHRAHEIINSMSAILMLGVFCILIYKEEIHSFDGENFVSRQRSPVTLKVKLLN